MISPILITGPWGSGKTTFLRTLQQRVDPDPKAKPRTIWFEAWRCDSEGTLLPALVRAVWQTTKRDSDDQEKLKQAFRSALFVTLHGLRFGTAILGQQELADAIGGIDRTASLRSWSRSARSSPTDMRCRVVSSSQSIATCS